MLMGKWELFTKVLSSPYFLIPFQDQVCNYFDFLSNFQMIDQDGCACDESEVSGSQQEAVGDSKKQFKKAGYWI